MTSSWRPPCTLRPRTCLSTSYGKTPSSHSTASGTLQRCIPTLVQLSLQLAFKEACARGSALSARLSGPCMSVCYVMTPFAKCEHCDQDSAAGATLTGSEAAPPPLPLRSPVPVVKAKATSLMSSLMISKSTEATESPG